MRKAHLYVYDLLNFETEKAGGGGIKNSISFHILGFIFAWGREVFQFITSKKWTREVTKI